MTMDPIDLERTPPWDTADATPAASEPLDVGQRFSRYCLERVLGEGTYGRVYLARHEVLGRRDAIKVLHRRHGSRKRDIRAFINEALIVARLDHSGIVPIYDAGWTEDGFYYYASRFIEGGDLGQMLKRRRFAPTEAARVIEVIAEALHYAHERGLVHRDIKPANILLDASGKPYVVDFGVALRDKDYGRGTRLAGTPAYMSPEQARGESHRVDGRSDIFSLGVMLYELLTGRRPFQGDGRDELLEQIVSAEAPAPRQIDHRIPDELERICLKAVAKRASERYPTARAMAEALRHFLGVVTEDAANDEATDFRPPGDASFTLSTRRMFSKSTELDHPGSGMQLLNIVPKGLSPYDVRDADFFPELLPGRRDRDGLPESLGFWRSRIEGRDDAACRVGLIFGPSGGGKSSLVRAGLLPRLSARIVTVYIEATADHTESDLLRGLRSRCPGIAPGAGLVETLVAIRKGAGTSPGNKVLIVLDQFERWLGNFREGDGGLMPALRQCDGEHSQAIVVVQDDCWAGASRFMRGLDAGIAEGENAASVDPFDLPHARKILGMLGRARNALPAWPSGLTEDQEAFLERAVSRLAVGGCILPIRLALFAEVVKGRAWSPATLEEFGGQREPGCALLDLGLGAGAGLPGGRLQRKAARSMLASLLPEPDAAYILPGRSHQELFAASGCSTRPSSFQAALQLLEEGLKLITRLDPEHTPGEGVDPSTESGAMHYRLAHDYLVSPLREWLSSKRRVALRGRPMSPPRGRAARSGASTYGVSTGPGVDGRQDDRGAATPMDINGAIIEDLQSLPGVGPDLARRIIEGRPYHSMEELLRIKGLSRTLLDKMAPFLTAGHATS